MNILFHSGTLDGFSFDSEEEADNLPKKADEGNQNEAIEDETNGKTERKAKKSLVCIMVFFYLFKEIIYIS